MRIEKAVIGKPIGNLYRKLHVLVFVTDREGRILLGEKKGFYPDGVARMIGGGIEEGEQPADAARRELSEELSVNVASSDLIPFGAVRTEASTSEGPMQMTTWIYGVELPSLTSLTASSDVTSIRIYSLDELWSAILGMPHLQGTFATNAFEFAWADWGKIYGPIHKFAFECFLRLKDAINGDRGQILSDMPEPARDHRADRRAA